MSILDAVFTARTYVSGRAERKALLLHRRLLERPLALVLWQLGAEPFSAAAVAWGRSRERFELSVAGEPRNRDHAFRALERFAKAFNPFFETPGADGAPQIIVANTTTVEMLGRLGRRLAYLPLEGPHAASEDLVRLGAHLQFLHRHASFPGQQLILAMTDLLGSHWATPQSPEERGSLAALDAWIEPGDDRGGYDAAAEAERLAIGPLPTEDDDEKVERLLEAFRKRPALGPFETHYRALVSRTWPLLWRCRDREAAYVEAPSVERRWTEDLKAYAFHMSGVQKGIRRRTRGTPRQTAEQLRRLERAQALVETEEACDDRLRMIPYLLRNEAVLGRVVSIDLTHQEKARVRMVGRPRVVVETVEPCLMPRGKKLYLTTAPKKQWILRDVEALGGGGSRLVVELQTSNAECMPRRGEGVCFSILTTDQFVPLPLPEKAPWTHESTAPPPAPLEEEA